MMPNVVRGSRMAGLLVYLAGPGKANEHTDPHLVAGDPAMMAWYDDNTLDRSSAMAIARHLDQPKNAFGVDVQDGHVWHCSLSLRAEEGQLTDEQWQKISEAFVEKMGFGTEKGTKAPTRWVAVRHGLSKAGNDHVHIALNLVREDGTKASPFRDFKRSQDACRELEREFGLELLAGHGAGTATRGFNPAEQEVAARKKARAVFEAARRDGVEVRTWWAVPVAERDLLVAAARTADQPRWDLARRVRACATSAGDEAEFVRRMRAQGLLVRPRFAEGHEDIVTGYSVAERPASGERPIWYGGGHLGRDLALPRLREEWPDTAQSATAAVAEWTAAKRGRRTVGVGREQLVPTPEQWAAAARDLARLRSLLGGVEPGDRVAWARVARQTAGAFAAWSTSLEDAPGPLARAADVLSRSAQLKMETRVPGPRDRTLAGAASLLMLAAHKGVGVTAQLVMVRELTSFAQALADVHLARGEAREASAIATAVRTELDAFRARLEVEQRALQAIPTPTSGASSTAGQTEAVALPEAPVAALGGGGDTAAPVAPQPPGVAAQEAAADEPGVPEATVRDWTFELVDGLPGGVGSAVVNDAEWPELVASVEAAARAGLDPAEVVAAASAGLNVDDESRPDHVSEGDVAVVLTWRVNAVVDDHAGAAGDAGSAGEWADPAPVYEILPEDPHELDVAPVPLEERVLAPAPAVDRVVELHEAAATFYGAQYAGSSAAGYVARRFGSDLSDRADITIGYAPNGWDALVQHLRHSVHAGDDELVDAGLARYSRRGSLIDVFRDRVVLGIRDADSRLIGFTGRAAPGAAADVPKYLNTPATHAFAKGEVLFGLAEHAGPGRTPVLAEGAFDAIAITLSGGGEVYGVAPCGTALTIAQARLLTSVAPAGRVLVATDQDEAGRKAAEQDYWRLTGAGADPYQLVMAGAGGATVKDPADLYRVDQGRTLAGILAAHELSPHLATTLMAARIAADRVHLEEGNAAAFAFAYTDLARIIAVLPAERWEEQIETAAALLGGDQWHADAIREQLYEISTSWSTGEPGQVTAEAEMSGSEGGTGTGGAEPLVWPRSSAVAASFPTSARAAAAGSPVPAPLPADGERVKRRGGEVRPHGERGR